MKLKARYVFWDKRGERLKRTLERRHLLANWKWGTCGCVDLPVFVWWRSLSVPFAVVVCKLLIFFNYILPYFLDRMQQNTVSINTNIKMENIKRKIDF